jgi:hypothetical protein
MAETVCRPTKLENHQPRNESFPFKIKRSHDKLAMQGIPKSNHTSFSRYYRANKSWQI